MASAPEVEEVTEPPEVEEVTEPPEVAVVTSLATTLTVALQGATAGQAS